MKKWIAGLMVFVLALGLTAQAGPRGTVVGVSLSGYGSNVTGGSVGVMTANRHQAVGVQVGYSQPQGVVTPVTVGPQGPAGYVIAPAYQIVRAT